MPTAPTSAPELIDLIRKSGVLAPEKLAGLTELGLPAEPQKAAAALVSQGLLTRFQAQQLLAGRHKGFRLGAYVIQDLLGRGGMGAVYLAEHMELNRRVAVKVLVPGKNEDQKLALERFLREARAAAALDHPNIVRIFDVARHNDVPYLVMEHVEGETLQQVLDRAGPIPYPIATDYIAQSAAGLHHAHEKKFVHRDIKPGNLMLDRSGMVKILDMGLARSASAQDKLTERLDHGAVVGTADFIAPEQALNLPNIDGRADIYSLGASFFALLLGKPPFEGNTTQKLLQHQLRSAPKLATLDSSLPKGLSAVVAKMLAKKPADRYQTPAEVIAALTPWMADGSRVLATLTQSSRAAGAELQAALSDLALGGSARRAAARTALVEDGSDSGTVNPFEAGRETASVAASVTTREPVRRAKQSKKLLTYIGIALTMAASAALGGWLAVEQTKKQRESAAGATPPPVGPELPPVTRSPPIEPKHESTAEKVVFNLAAVDLPPFRNTRKGYDIVTGDEAPAIRGVSFGAPKPEALSEWTCGPVGGRQALGLTNLNEVAAAQIAIDLEKSDGVGLKLEPGHRLRLRVTYRSAGTGQGTMYFQTYDIGLVPARAALPNSNAEWKTVDLLLTRGEKPIRCLIDNTERGPGNTLSIRTITVADLGKEKPPPDDPHSPPPTDPARWAEGRVIYSLDVAKIPPFRVKKEQFTRTTAEAEQLPVGIGCHSWKDGAVGEFRCEKFDGVPVLSVTNLNDQMSGQFYFQLEGEMGLPLRPGKAYRLKIGYTTANDGAGATHIQVTPGYKTITTASLSNSDGKWRTATMMFVRPPAEDNVEVRMVIDNTSVGEGNSVLVRSLEIVELVPPEKK